MIVVGDRCMHKNECGYFKFKIPYTYILNKKLMIFRLVVSFNKKQLNIKIIISINNDTIVEDKKEIINLCFRGKKKSSWKRPQ